MFRMIASPEINYYWINFNSIDVGRSVTKSRCYVIAGSRSSHQNPIRMRDEPIGKLIGWQGRAIRLGIRETCNEVRGQIEYLLMIVVINVDEEGRGVLPALWSRKFK